MKIRTDFVTNSSSSSFIVASKKDLSNGLRSLVSEEDLKNNPFMEMVFDMVDVFKQNYFSNIDDLKEWLGYEKEDELDEYECRDIQNFLKEGKNVYMFEVDNDDSTGHRLLDSLNMLEDVEVSNW